MRGEEGGWGEGGEGGGGSKVGRSNHSHLPQGRKGLSHRKGVQILVGKSVMKKMSLTIIDKTGLFAFAVIKEF